MLQVKIIEHEKNKIYSYLYITFWKSQEIEVLSIWFVWFLSPKKFSYSCDRDFVTKPDNFRVRHFKWGIEVMKLNEHRFQLLPCSSAWNIIILLLFLKILQEILNDHEVHIFYVLLKTSTMAPMGWSFLVCVCWDEHYHLDLGWGKS